MPAQVAANASQVVESADYDFFTNKNPWSNPRGV